MSDVVSPEKRSRMMSGIKGRNTKPEIIVRKALYRRGFRYRLHGKHLPGKPDLVFGRYNTVLFINGCFWHGHDCRLFKWPKSNVDFWKEKFEGNRRRDEKNVAQLQGDGWHVIIIWECAIRRKNDAERQRLFDRIELEIKNDNRTLISHAG